MGNDLELTIRNKKTKKSLGGVFLGRRYHYNLNDDIDEKTKCVIDNIKELINDIEKMALYKALAKDRETIEGYEYDINSVKEQIIEFITDDYNSLVISAELKLLTNEENFKENGECFLTLTDDYGAIQDKDCEFKVDKKTHEEDCELC